MQAQRTPFNIVEAQLKNGEKVRVNDHVYSAPPWEKREPVPYSIGRILEFLPPETSQEAKSKGKGRSAVDKTLRVRLAWYYRPTDVQDRGSGDHRTLLAAMFSEVVPIINLRAKCIVRHRDKIQDLAAYKKKEDRFYFSQLFDPFTKENYEVILASEVHNLPTTIKEVLVSRYEYVVCEKEALPDLQDTLRLCETCGDWCPTPESVMCELCKKHYHMHCVTPPLLSKPSRGYGWSCASCNDKRGNHEDAPGKVRGIKDPYKSKNKLKQPLRQYSEEDNDKYWKGWSFRYFGQHTVAEDTLDPDDMIYVRAPTRVGKAYQAMLPAFGEPSFVNEDGLTRGGDDTIELLSNVVHMPEELVAEVDKRKAVLSLRGDLQCSVDWLEECIRRMSEAYANKLSFYSVNMKNPLRTRRWKTESRYTDREWNEEEASIFDESVRKHASELRAVKNDLKTRTMPEIVRYFGKWKTAQLRKANLAAANAPPEASPAPRGRLDEEGSIYKPGDRRTFTCGVCRTKESPAWWKAPKALAGGAMCNECGLAWRKYNVRSLKGTEKEKEIEKQKAIERAERAERKAQETPDRESPPVTRSAKLKANGNPSTGATASSVPAPETRAERAERRGENNSLAQSTGKRERETSPLAGPPSKRQKMTNGVAPIPRLMCSLCRRIGPQGQIVKCVNCNFTIHAGCVGVLPEEATADWACEICSNEKTEASHLDTACVICPKKPADRKRGAKDSAFFRAAKPTENRGWVHVLCATFNPHLEYSDGRRMRLVEGISAIPGREWRHLCKCCGDASGCLVRCEQCLAVFHPVCGWNHGYKFGFELVPAKSHQRRDWPTVEFKGEVGWLGIVVLCDNHPVHSRKVYDLCEMDDSGKTVLELYNETYKQAQPGEKSYGLLRKARRLDDVVRGPRFDSTPLIDPAHAPPSDQKCIHCATEFSPFWWPAEEASLKSAKVMGLNGTTEEMDIKIKVINVNEEDTVMEDRTAPVTNDSLKEVANGVEVELKQLETDRTSYHPAQCHSCYFKQHQESDRPFILDLSDPIPILGA